MNCALAGVASSAVKRGKRGGVPEALLIDEGSCFQRERGPVLLRALATELVPEAPALKLAELSLAHDLKATDVELELELLPPLALSARGT